jgi:WD40 repeat protein
MNEFKPQDDDFVYEGDDNDDFQYEEIIEEQDVEEEDDDLLDAFASIQEKNKIAQQQSLSNSITQVRPSVVDDFIRNFLIKAGMKKSVDVFNTEWYELQSKGKLPAELSVPVPDIYLRNEELDQQTKQLREQVEKMRLVSQKAEATWDKFRKERDFHRMHHKRVVQEKNKLIDDIRRLRNHMRSYEPAIEELKRRHEVAIKEKMLTRLERDRLKTRVKVLEEQVSTLSQPPKDEPAAPTKAIRTVRKHAVFPQDDPTANPYNNLQFEPAPYEIYSNTKTYKGHLNSISSVAFHPKKPIFATASDDETWRLWTISDNELVMSGEGHNSWLSGIHFHPHGSHLATSSGDSTVKIWEFSQAKCTHTFTDHTQAVWGCEFHHAGDFVASCSMDHTVRIWDLISGKCKQTLRGHVDSVNACAWQPYTANVCSASGDKTVSVWDGRTGLCVQTLYGHSNSVNHLVVSNRGDTIVSADADGIVKVWDIRMVAELGTCDIGPHPINKVCMDRGEARALCASDDGTIKIVDLQNFQKVGDLAGHESAVQCVASSPNDSYVVSGSSDASYKVWAK